jgi:hypothetical protein
LSLHNPVIKETDNSLKAFSSIIRYLCKLRASHPGADIDYEPGFKVLATIIAAHQLDKEM